MVGTTLGLQNQTVLTNYDMKHCYQNIAFIVCVCVMMVIFVTGVIGNVLVVFVTSYKMKTTVKSIWFLNLAITDLIFSAILLTFIILFFECTFKFNDLMLKCVNDAFCLNMFASAFFLTIISLDRCLCTWCVAWAQNKRTLFKARIICAFVWLLAICSSIPFAIHISKPHHILPFQQIKNEYKFLFLYLFMVGFLIPFLIITSSYIAIVVRVRRFPSGNQLRKFRVVFVIFAFFISWFPFHFRYLVIMWASSDDRNDIFHYIINYVYVIALFTAFLNSCLNPILYVFMCDEYKKKLKKSLLLVLEGAFTEDHLGLH